MQIIIGIDLGGSTTKFVACTMEKHLIAMAQMDSKKPIMSKIEAFLKESKLDRNKVAKIVLTGVGASFIKGNLFDIPTVKISEFEAIGYGGLYVASLREALVISMGTGTALVQSSYENRKHIGGIGLGGGTLCGLGKLLLKENRLEELSQLAKEGSLRKIDLLVGDICCDEMETLPLCLTASNFGKLEEEASKEDLALGLINMIFQAIGKMAMFTCLGTSTKDIILTGSLAGIKQTKEIFKTIGELYHLNFIIPPNPAFCTALGAIIAQEHLSYTDVNDGKREEQEYLNKQENQSGIPNIELALCQKSDLEILSPIIKRSFDEDTKIHLGKEGGPRGYNNGKLLQIMFYDKELTLYKIMLVNEIIGGVVVRMKKENQHNTLELFFLDTKMQEKGIGIKVWHKLEKLYPETIVWEGETPIYSKRNHNFYVNKCGFHIIGIKNPKDLEEGSYLLQKRKK